ncbi:MAG: hypothetical protein JNM22_06845 [Saprospiraceae bacterium]|nr:hypothetical protein [Saprospiraceae bacterium]
MKVSRFLFFPMIVCLFACVSCIGQTPKKTPSEGAEKDSLVPSHKLDNRAWRLRLERFALREGLARPENQDTSTWLDVLEQFSDPRFDSISKQLEGISYIQYHRLKNSYVSHLANRQIIPVNWDSILVNNMSVVSFGLPKPVTETKSLQSLSRIYEVNQNHAQTSKTLEGMGVNAPISKLRKAALLGIDYQHELVNPTGFLAHQSKYVYTLLHIWMIDSTTFLQKDIPPGTYGHTIFDVWLIKIYTPDGKLLLSLQTKEPIRPGYLLQLSNDERFVLIGTIYDIGDEEGYEPTGPFVLYNISNKRTTILPAINPNDKQKYPNGIGELAESKFISPFFQLTYYNGPEIGTRFLIDPYKKVLYFRHYPAPTFSEVFTNEGRFRPSISPDGQIKDIDEFLQTSF